MNDASETIIISPEDRPAVLAALYNASRPLGLGILHFTPDDMTVEQAAKLIEQQTRTVHDGSVEIYFDYLKGRVMKVDLGRPELDFRLYDRDNGPGAGMRALEAAGVA